MDRFGPNVGQVVLLTNIYVCMIHIIYIYLLPIDMYDT